MRKQALDDDEMVLTTEVKLNLFMLHLCVVVELGLQYSPCSLCPGLYLLVCIMIKSYLIVLTDLHLCLCSPHHLWHHHVVVYPFPPTDSIQYSLVHTIGDYQVMQSATHHLTPATLSKIFFSFFLC